MNTIHEDIVREYTTIRHDIDTLTARKKEIEKVLRDLDFGNHQIAGVTIQIQHNRRIDPVLFAERYPVTKHPKLWKPGVNTTEARKQLAPTEIDELSREGEAKVVLKA